jgi:hypothetical protein
VEAHAAFQLGLGRPCYVKGYGSFIAEPDEFMKVEKTPSAVILKDMSSKGKTNIFNAVMLKDMFSINDSIVDMRLLSIATSEGAVPVLFVRTLERHLLQLS